MTTKIENDEHLNKMVEYYTKNPKQLNVLFRLTQHQFKQIQNDTTYYKILLYIIIILNFIYFFLKASHYNWRSNNMLK